MQNLLTTTIHRSLIAVLCFQLMGCGTLLYPERRGQKAGHLDAGVVILDAIGLLFFLVPGIIAFAVDFSNGTIYLPSNPLRSELKEIKFDPKRTSMAQIEKIIKDETGKTVKLTQGNIQVTRLKSNAEMKTCFAQTQSEIQNNQLASL